MLDRILKFLSLTSIAFSLSLLWCLPANASLAPAGQVILADGPFIAIQTNASARSLTRGSEFYQGDRLWTGPRTRAQIQFSDGAIMTLRPDTEFSVDEYEFDEKNVDSNKSFFTLLKGGFRTLTGLISKLKPDSYQVKTAYAIVGVRGTTYEVVDQNALYVAAWEGTISISNNSAEMLLGFGQNFNYATVTSINSAPTGSVEVPPPLQQAPDPGLQQALVDPTETRLATAVSDPIEEVIPPRLSTTEVASLDRSGFAAFTGTGTAPLRGAANDLAGSNPIVFDQGVDVVLRQATALPVNVGTNTTLGAAFPVSFGEWDATTSNPATIQPDAIDSTVIQNVVTPVFWMTLFPATSVGIATGSVSYNNVLNFAGDGSGGAVTGLSFDGTLDFNTGALNGNMLVTNADTWDVDFTGSLSGAQFTAAAIGSSTFNGTPGVTGSLTGSLTGDPSGFGAQAPLGMGGVFDFESGANDVAGTFLARHDGRFFAGEQTTLAASTQVGFAAFGGAGVASATMLSGTATDGAGGSPILFDQTAGPDGTVLRRDVTAGTDTVTTDNTLAGFQVSFGEWDAPVSPAAQLPDPNGTTVVAVNDPVFWLTVTPTPTAALPVNATYNFTSLAGQLVSQGAGSGGGPVTVASFSANFDFSTGQVTSGNMVVVDGATNWNTQFLPGGTISGASFNLQLDPTNSVVGANPATGTVNGAVTGPAAQGVAGAFDFREQGNPTTFVQGAFYGR